MAKPDPSRVACEGITTHVGDTRPDAVAYDLNNQVDGFDDPVSLYRRKAAQPSFVV